MTLAERRFRKLVRLWNVLFFVGALAATAAAATPAGERICVGEPLLAFVWLGQVFLFLTSFFLLRGAWSSEAPTVGLVCYKSAAGFGMLLFPLWMDLPARDELLLIGGGITDLAMGGATLLLWRLARGFPRKGTNRSATPIDESRSGNVDGRRVLLAGYLWFSICAIGLAVACILLPVTKSGIGMVAAANGCGLYAGFGGICRAESKSPRRRADFLIAVSVVAAVGLFLWLMRFPVPAGIRSAYVSGACLHLLFAALVLSSNWRTSARARDRR